MTASAAPVGPTHDAMSGFRCPVCAGTGARPHLRLPDWQSGDERTFQIVRCARCGLLRLHPPPSDADLAAAYGASYAPHARAGVSGWAKGHLERRSVRQLRAYFAAPNRVLDIGCATGELLLAVRALGNPNVTGVEPGARAAETARRRGLEVHVGTLETAQLDDASVDTVVMSHTLEHVRDPAATLREVRRVLRPGGALILWLPNVDSVEARVLGRYWIGYDAPRHLTTFGLSTLATLLEETDFQVAQVRHEAVGLEWAWALRLWVGRRARRSRRVLTRLHPILVIAATPLAAVGAIARRSGRVRVIARAVTRD